MQPCPTPPSSIGQYLRRCVEVGLGHDEPLHDRQLALLRSKVEGCGSILQEARVRVRTGAWGYGLMRLYGERVESAVRQRTPLARKKGE